MIKVYLAGHLGKDPETRFSPNGVKITTFSIATNQRKGKEEVTTWVRVVIWSDRFDKMLPYLKKGSAVIVSGSMNPPSSYTDKEGRTQISLEITADDIQFSPFGKSERSVDGQGQSNTNNYSQSFSPNGPAYADEGTKQPSYAKSQTYGIQTGQGNQYAENIDEDALPF
jgi:single-strand DNA-binding protein